MTKARPRRVDVSFIQSFRYIALDHPFPASSIVYQSNPRRQVEDVKGSQVKGLVPQHIFFRSLDTIAKGDMRTDGAKVGLPVLDEGRESGLSAGSSGLDLRPPLHVLAADLFDVRRIVYRVR